MSASEFWLVVNPSGGNLMGIQIFESEQDAIRFKTMMENPASGLADRIIYHFVDGIPRDVTPGRENAKIYPEFDKRTMLYDTTELKDRLDKIEARLDALENKPVERHEDVIAEFRRLFKPDHVADASKKVDLSADCGKVERPADASKTMPSSGAEAESGGQLIVRLIGGSLDPRKGVNCSEVYRSAVAHYRKAHPHLTIDELIRYDARFSPNDLRHFHDRIAASRKEPE